MLRLISHESEFSFFTAFWLCSFSKYGSNADRGLSIHDQGFIVAVTLFCQTRNKVLQLFGNGKKLL